MSPNVTAAEVRAAYLRRVRDVHPDAGGTGDGLTMRLLTEARDEALEQLEARAPNPRLDNSSATSPPARRKARQQYGRKDSSKPTGRPCNICQQQFPREQLSFKRLPRGFRGRRQTGEVLVCSGCSPEVDEFSAPGGTHAADPARRRHGPLCRGRPVVLGIGRKALVQHASEKRVQADLFTPRAVCRSSRVGS